MLAMQMLQINITHAKYTLHVTFPYITFIHTLPVQVHFQAMLKWRVTVIINDANKDNLGDYCSVAVAPIFMKGPERSRTST